MLTPTITTALEVLRVFREFTGNADMPSQQVAIILHCATHKGQTLGQIADAVGLTSSAVSRNVARLGRGIAWNERGADLLVVEEDLHDRRAKVVNLSQRGSELVERIGREVAPKTAAQFSYVNRRHAAKEQRA